MKKILVKDFCVHCMTREKGKKFYAYLAKVTDLTDIEFDFSGVEYVSTSFLDESVWKLISAGKNIGIYDPRNIVEEKLYLIRKWEDERV